VAGLGRRMMDVILNIKRFVSTSPPADYNQKLMFFVSELKTPNSKLRKD